MDTYRDFPSEYEPPAASQPQESTTAAIGTDERRMHVRAYNYWVSLLDGRDFPSIEDLEPGDLADFAPNSVLLDFTSGRDDPATPYVGAAIRSECDLGEEVKTIAEVPSRSLLSRLTDHYMQIIANRAPVGFEAEFENQRGESICYRGILMPFSSDGDTIDFIYGVINWKKVEQQSATVTPAPVASDVEAVSFGEPIDVTEIAALATESAEPDEEEVFDVELGDDAGLADRLSAARECAETVKSAEGRTREALYRALSRAYDLSVASREQPEDYAELLEDSGVKAQARAPMTAIVKLVFGIDYDKARLTEYSAALSYADRSGIELGGFLAFIEAQAGGLKALVAAERQARRPQPKADTKTALARERLRTASPVDFAAISSEEEFALVLTRRSGGGKLEAIAVVEDSALVERAIRQVGG